MNTSAATDSTATKEVALDTNAKELVNGGGNFTPVGLAFNQLHTPCTEKRYLKLRTDINQFRTNFSLYKHSWF
jgi:hypothetical protein